MAGGVSSGKGGVKADINVTPLVDVVFVLLIIFMVVTPMLASGKEVELPQARSSAASESSKEHVVLTVTADKRVWLEQTPVDVRELEAPLRARLAQLPGATVLVKADSSVSMADVRPVMRRLKDARIHQVAFLVAEGTETP